MPSFFGGFGVNEAIGLGGGLANAITGRSAAKSQKEYMRRLSQGADLSNQLFRKSMPLYEQTLQDYAQRAGIGTPGVQKTGEGQYRVTPPDRQFGMGGNYGNQEDQLRLQAAEEQINDYFRQQANQLRHGSQGGAGLQAGLARLAGQQGEQYAGFRRNLAINAGQEQERRLQGLQQMLGFGLGQGGAAQAGYANLAGQYGQQAAAANQGLAGILQNYQMQRLMQQYGQQPGGGNLDPYGYSADTYSPYNPSPYDPYDPYGLLAQTRGR